MSLPFIPGYLPSSPRLLSRFLPPLAEGMAAHYIDQHTRPGDLVFDPFGQSPRVAVEALSLGRRIVVATFNPISRVALSFAVRSPTAVELRSALTVLADMPIGGHDPARLETYLRTLYATTCTDCHTPTTADVLEWDADDDTPIEKTYYCPQCGAHKSRPTDEADRSLAGRFTWAGLDYYFLLDRVAARDDPDRNHVQEALAVYPARALTAIAATLVKLDALHAPPDVRRLLAGLLIAAFDAASALGPDRPRALAQARHYKEINFWLALENAVGMLAGVSAPDLSMTLADLVARFRPAGIYAHAGSARELASALPEDSCSLVISAIPRPNPAYWTLSAIWSAWLWGRDSPEAQRMTRSLRRRRYDWAWHADALQRTFDSILGQPEGPRCLMPGGKMIGLVPEAEPGFTACVFAAVSKGPLAVESAVLRADTAEAQFVCELQQDRVPPAATTAEQLDAQVQAAARESAAQALSARGEPSRWTHVHFAAWRALAEERLLAGYPEDPLSRINHLLDPVFRDAHTFRRFAAAGDDDLATGQWYLSDVDGRASTANPPLADRVEAEVLRLLSERAGGAVEEHEVLRDVCSAFPGVQTPGRGLVLACLASYAQKLDSGLWRLRAEDASAARAQGLQAIQAELRALAVRNEYAVAGANPQEWREAGQTIYLFAVITSAVLSTYLLGTLQPARRRFLVLPGGRAGLAEYKLRRDPRLRAALQTGNWMIVKFRHVRRMAADAHVTRATLEPAFESDPLEAGKQLALLADE